MGITKRQIRRGQRSMQCKDVKRIQKDRIQQSEETRGIKPEEE
jgi:hypothetical protein